MIEGVRMRFDHVSIAVRSIDRAYQFFQRYFPVHFRNEKRRDDQVSGSFLWQAELHAEAMLKAVFFDAAGTLFDAREPVGHTYTRIARKHQSAAKRPLLLSRARSEQSSSWTLIV